ncbi:hypothetical protein IFM89_038113 [Coptis chinensis]|uniref:Fe2OG dioxygenase domain-containing protein n=1 Tax=Coptis chinensis TaxID=261450 RepID=A0A835HQE7_9MAGN|nr:hypothetical protein IFM89_038113 [Coptis chinensis]
MAPAISESRDLTEFVAKQGNGVKGLAETGLKSVPKQYIQPLEERMDMQNVVTQESIPVIDMSKWDDPHVMRSICDAAEKWGFFQVTNHGVPVEVLENVKEATKKFFGLPAEEKMMYTKENSLTNNVRYGTSFVPEAEESLEWKDYLSLFYTSEEEAYAFWPKECKEHALEFIKGSELLIRRLLEALMEGLKVMSIDATKSLVLTGSKRINFNFYPKCPNPELTVGVGRHSDVSTLTILLQDDIGGLYVRGIGGKGWIHVPPMTGSLVINVGDALQIMSNGHYKSIEHRVVANGSNDRISVPIFVNPRPHDTIGPLPELLEMGEKPVYKQVLYSDYVKHFFNKAHDGKKTIDFAKI